MHGPFVALTLLTLGAAILVWLLQRINLSPILGYLTLGVLVGPFKHSLFHDEKGVETMAEFGVVLLMFFIGLEFHLSEMRKMLKLCLVGGGLQVGLSALAAGVAAWLLGVPPRGAGVVGLMFAFSSTALVMKAFEDRREDDSARARTSLAVLLFQDIAAILAVAVLPMVADAKPGEAQSAWAAAGKLAFLIVVLPLIFMGARYLLPRFFEKTAVARVPEAFSLLSLGACFSVALAAQFAGASMALGAFLGGLVLCQTPFASQILADLNTVRNLALAFFFVTVGMLVDLRFVADNALYLAGALAGLVLLKTALTGVALMVVRTPAAVAGGVGLAIAQIGEFSFVLGAQAQTPELGLLDAKTFQFVLTLAVFSMLLTPFLVGWSGSVGQWLGSKEPVPEQKVSAAHAEVAAPRAIVVGFGPVGRTLARILQDFDQHPTIIDMNLETVKKLKAAGIDAIYGDAGRREILQLAKVEKAAYLLVTLPDLAGRIPVIAAARILNPEIKIFARARYLGERAMLEDSGATAVSYEEAEVAVSLATYLLEEIGAKDEKIEKEARRIRTEISIRSGFTTIMRGPLKKEP